MKRFLSIACICLIHAGCSVKPVNIPDEAYSPDARLATHTKTAQLLEQLPAPTKPLVVAVYQFQDQTGQNKPSDTPQYSKAVTQGGLSILKKALLDASKHQWFRVTERGDLPALLQERQIVRSERLDYTGPDGKKLPALPPMLYAGMIIEGGIVAYDSNVMTGGIGARYLAIGGDSQYSRDMVTVYLRLVSVATGEVLLSVNTSKTIYSTGIQGGAYKFVSYDNLLETEAGVTYNEPPQLAVRQAIELGVYALVMEGYRNRLWQFGDPTAGNAAFALYRKEYLGENDATPPAASFAASTVTAQKLTVAENIPQPAAPQAAQTETAPQLNHAVFSQPKPASLVAESSQSPEAVYLAKKRNQLLEQINARLDAHENTGTLLVMLGVNYEREKNTSRAIFWYEKALATLASAHDTGSATAVTLARQRLTELTKSTSLDTTN